MTPKKAWTRFGIVGASSPRSSYDVNLWRPYSNDHCQNYAANFPYNVRWVGLAPSHDISSRIIKCVSHCRAVCSNINLLYDMNALPIIVVSFNSHALCVTRLNVLWYVWKLIKQSKSLQTRYDKTHVYNRYDNRTHVYVFLLSVKKHVVELSRVWPWRWPRGGTTCKVFIGPVFHKTT